METKLAPRWPALALVAVGLAFCVYLEFIHVQTFLAPTAKAVCSIDENFDCSTVALSRLAVVFAVPLPVWGFAGFVSMGLAAWHRSRLLPWLTGFGAISSIALFVEAAFFVESICLFCEGVHVVCLGLFGYAIAYRRRLNSEAPSRLELIEVLALPATVVIATALFAPRYWELTAWQNGVPHPHGVDDEGHPWVGAESPKVVVHEYTDYSCNHCAVGTALMRQRLAKDPDEIRIVRHQQPRMHCRPSSQGCAHVRAALCAGEQDRFWEMDSWLFLHAPGRQLTDYQPAVAELGLDYDTLLTCMEREDIYAFGERDYKDATKRKIRNTPGYVVDGKRFQPSEVFGVIDDRL